MNVGKTSQSLLWLFISVLIFTGMVAVNKILKKYICISRAMTALYLPGIMIYHIQKIKALNIFWGFLALFMLNISIDMADAPTHNSREDLSFNEQESIVEYVLEEMMGIEDAIPESEDNDASQNSPLKKTAGLDYFIIAPVPAKQPAYYISLQNQYRHQPDARGTSRYIEIVSPPPEAG